LRKIPNSTAQYFRILIGLQ